MRDFAVRDYKQRMLALNIHEQSRYDTQDYNELDYLASKFRNSRCLLARAYWRVKHALAVKDYVRKWRW